MSFVIYRSIHLVVTTLALQDTISSDLRSRARSALLLERLGSSNQECEVDDTAGPCPPSKFRSPTSECNNVNHRHWGSRGDVFMRMVAPDYADGKSSPRTSVGSHALPSPDHIIQQLQKSINKDAQHPHITAMLPAWGQLLAYDLFQVISPQSSSYKCCEEKTKSSEDLIQCYVRTGDDCKEYMRSIPSRDFQTCEFNYREQMNAASGFIDGSGLYGVTEKEFQALRTFSGGQVDIKACARCNEAGAIGALHVILLKEHNRIAEELAKLNNDWSDATLFLEARRALTAEIQHITFNEFLPIVLGQQTVTKDELR